MAQILPGPGKPKAAETVEGRCEELAEKGNALQRDTNHILTRVLEEVLTIRAMMSKER